MLNYTESDWISIEVGHNNFDIVGYSNKEDNRPQKFITICNVNFDELKVNKNEMLANLYLLKNANLSFDILMKCFTVLVLTEQHFSPETLQYTLVYETALLVARLLIKIEQGE